MRVTFGTKYNQMASNQGGLAQKLNETNTQIASGLKIQHGWQDASVLNQDLRFGYNESTLAQGIDVSNNAHTNTLNTDQALVDISKAMTEFKTKLLHAANEIHTPTSRNAIANDLQSLRDHIINIGNTSIGGNYIFSGSRTNIKPFDNEGNYHGNDEDLKALISSQNAVPYNINGQELFYGNDSDKHRKITTNLKLINQSKMHPATMDKVNRSDLPSEVFIKEEDTLRDLIGDNDNFTNNDDKQYFYIRGVRSDGVSFKDKFSLDVAYTNPKSATRVQDLLDRIGKSFGNTHATKVVDVRLNAWGQIEIQDLRNGSSSMQFSMVSSNKDVEDLRDIAPQGGTLKVYNALNVKQDFSLSTLQGVNDKYDNRVVSIPTTLIKKDNTLGEKDTKLDLILNAHTRYIKISGTPPNTKDGKISTEEPKKPIIFDTKGKDVKDLMKAINAYFGDSVDVELDKGVINIYDNHVKNKSKDLFEPPFDGEHSLSVKLEALDENGKSTNAFSAALGFEEDKTLFKPIGSKLVSNVAQMIAGDSKPADQSTKLTDVSKGDINGQTYNMNLLDHNGVAIDAKIHFNQQGSFLELPPKKAFHIQSNGEKVDNPSIKIPLYNPKDEPPAVTISDGNNVTYRQLMDALSIALNYSNEDNESLLKAQTTNGKPTQESKDAYNLLLQRANNNVTINLDNDGKMVVQDNIRSITRMQVAFYNKTSDDFSQKELDSNKSNVLLNANVALTIDDPKISFFKGIDETIQAVRMGIDRAGALGDQNYNEYMENRGIQNSIALIDHLSDHIEKVIAKNGSHSKTFENAVTKNEAIKTQVSSIKGDTIGADLAETYNKFSNLSNNYQAVLSSTNKINQMSLVDYLK